MVSPQTYPLSPRLASSAAYQAPAGGGCPTPTPPLELRFHHLALVTEIKVGVWGLGGNVDTHDARKRVISHGQSSRSGTGGRELHIARWGRAISCHPFSLSRSFCGHSCSSFHNAAVSSSGYFSGVFGQEGELKSLFLGMGLGQE